MKSTHPDFAELVTLLVQCHHHLIHNSSFTGSQKGATIPFGVAPVSAVQLIFILWQRHRFPNDHVLARNTNARCDETVIIQFFVDGVSHTYESFDCVFSFSPVSRDVWHIIECLFFTLAGFTCWFLKDLLLIKTFLWLLFFVWAIENRSAGEKGSGFRLETEQSHYYYTTRGGALTWRSLCPLLICSWSQSPPGYNPYTRQLLRWSWSLNQCYMWCTGVTHTSVYNLCRYVLPAGSSLKRRYSMDRVVTSGFWG